MTKKTTPKKKAPKKAPALEALPEAEVREFGPVVHRWRAPRSHAIGMIRALGYRVAADEGDRVIIEGDAEAHGRWTDHDRDDDGDSGA